MREYGPGRPLVFNHIPKTAGSSLRAALRQVLAPTVEVGGFDRSLFGGYDDISDAASPLRDSVHLSPEALPLDASLVAGHISPATTLARYPDADHITFLRTPQVRLLSQFLHSRSVTEFNIRGWGKAAEGFRAGWSSLREYLQNPMVAPNVDNTITRFFAWPHPLLEKTAFVSEDQDDELLGSALERLDRMDFVGILENPRCMADLSAWLGRELPDTRLNERASVPRRMRPNLADELSDGTRELLDHRCRMDVRLWDHVAATVLPSASDLAPVREKALERAVQRYDAMLAEPDHRPPLRRVVEDSYALGLRLRPRRRSR